MTTVACQRTWTVVGADWNGSDDKKALLSLVFSRLVWKDAALGLKLPAMAGAAISQAIRDLRIPRVSHLAVSHELAPCGLYGVRGHYTNGMAQFYVLDRGAILTVLASDFHLKD